MRLVAEPPPQLVARRETPSPVREPALILRDPPGPDAVHQDTPTVFLVRLLVHPLDLDVHVPPLPRLGVARELLRSDIVIVDPRLVQCLTHRTHHRGRAVDVVKGERKIADVFREHCFGGMPRFPMPLPDFSIAVASAASPSRRCAPQTVPPAPSIHRTCSSSASRPATSSPLLLTRPKWGEGTVRQT
jgi:hypothetical protein